MNYELIWNEGSAVPTVGKGDYDTFIVAVMRGERGPFTFPACYLHAYPLEYDGDCVCPSEEDHCDDGCPTTGWFTDRFHPDYSNYFESLLNSDKDKLIAWSKIPAFKIPTP